MAKRCPRCGYVVPSDIAKYCPRCGFYFGPPRKGVIGAALENILSLVKPNPPEKVVTGAVYAREYTGFATSFAFLIISVALFLGGYYLTFGHLGDPYIWLKAIQLTILGLLGPLLFFAWMYKRDKFEPEPKSLALFAFAWGVFAAYPSFLLNTYVFGPFLGSLSGPLVEEPLKGLGVYFLAKKKEFNDHMDGLVYGFAAGMGFAAIENFFYLLAASQHVVAFTFQAIFRVFLYGMNHGIYTGITGRWLGLQKVRYGDVTFNDYLAGIAGAMLLHGIWNFTAELCSTFLDVLIWMTPLAVIYLIMFLKLVKEALRDEALWGYAAGYAPVEK